MNRPHDNRPAAWTEAELGLEGRVLEVVRAPDPVLATAGERIDQTDPEWGQLAADLVATMRVSPGCVGLAAQQVGIAAQIFCVDVSTHPTAASTTPPSCSATPRSSGRAATTAPARGA
jgi:peptide deformylase